MTPFDPSQYPASFALLWEKDRLPELGPGRPSPAARAILGPLSLDRFPVIQDPQAAVACLSGLYLLHDCLDESHTLCQDIDSWFGSYWHGIMHRREPDPDNAKYWFRRVQANPVYEALAADAAELGLPGRVWDPFGFVDQCERERGTGSDAEMLCRRVQLREMQLLFGWCFRAAAGASRPDDDHRPGRGRQG